MPGEIAERAIGGVVGEVILRRGTEGGDKKFERLPPELWPCIGDFCDQGAYNNLRLASPRSFFISSFNQVLAPLRVPARYLSSPGGDGQVLQERYKNFGGLREVNIRGEQELEEFLEYLGIAKADLEMRHLNFSPNFYSYNEKKIMELMDKFSIVDFKRAKVGYLHVLKSISYGCLFSFFKCFSSLKGLEVSLGTVNFREIDLKISEPVAKLLRSLVRLKITCDNPCGAGKNNFFSLLGSCSMLQTFTLEIKQIPSAKMFRELLACNKPLDHLQQLEIQAVSPRDINKFSGEEIRDFLCSLPSLKKLTMPLTVSQLSFLLGDNRLANLRICSEIFARVQRTTKICFVDRELMILGSLDMGLTVRNDDFFNKDVLLGLGRYWSKLTEFEVVAEAIDNFVSLVVDPAFKDICQKIEVVALNNVSINSELINKISSSLPNLTQLLLIVNNAEVYSAAAGSSVENPGLARLTKLHIVCSSAEQALHSLRIVLRGSPELKELSLKVPSIEDETPWLLFIQEFADKSKKLKSLQISTQNSLSLELIRSLRESFSELTSLDVNIDKWILMDFVY